VLYHLIWHACLEAGQLTHRTFTPEELVAANRAAATRAAATRAAATRAAATRAAATRAAATRAAATRAAATVSLHPEDSQEPHDTCTWVPSLCRCITH